MPWKVKKILLTPEGEVYAQAGTYLDDTDPVALAAKPNQVVRVQPQDAEGVPLRILVEEEPESEPWPEEEEEDDGDEGIDL